MSTEDNGSTNDPQGGEPIEGEVLGGDLEGTPTMTDRVERIDLQTEMQRSYLDYAMAVIVGRALPDVRDGLKPVHRRVIYAMYDGGYRPDRSFNKCARVVLRPGSGCWPGSGYQDQVRQGRVHGRQGPGGIRKSVPDRAG